MEGSRRSAPRPGACWRTPTTTAPGPFALWTKCSPAATGRGADVLRLLFAQAGRLVAAAILIGLVATQLAGRSLRGLLFDVSPFDPFALSAALFTLLLCRFWLATPRQAGGPRGPDSRAANGIGAGTRARPPEGAKKSGRMT